MYSESYQYFFSSLLSKNEASEKLRPFAVFLLAQLFLLLNEIFQTKIFPHVHEETRQRAMEDPEYFRAVLLEVQRLWPPFIGGRRIAAQVGPLTGDRAACRTE